MFKKNSHIEATKCFLPLLKNFKDDNWMVLKSAGRYGKKTFKNLWTSLLENRTKKKESLERAGGDENKKSSCTEV